MTEGFRYPLIVVLAITMGIQNATAAQARSARLDHHRAQLDPYRHRCRQLRSLEQGFPVRTPFGLRGHNADRGLVGAGVGHSCPHRPSPVIALIVIVAVAATTRLLGSRIPLGPCLTGEALLRCPARTHSRAWAHARRAKGLNNETQEHFWCKEARLPLKIALLGDFWCKADRTALARKVCRALSCVRRRAVFGSLTHTTNAKRGPETAGHGGGPRPRR